jgi:hypothetical protein
MKDDTLFRIECPWSSDKDHMASCFVPVETKREWRCTHPNVDQDDYEGDCGDWPLWRKDKAHAACGWRTYVKEEVDE